MISVIVSSNKDNLCVDKFKNHIKKTSGLKEYEILLYNNQNEFSLSEIYNRGLKESKYDILVFCHDDIFLSQNWGVKLLNDFLKNPEFGVIGKAGSCFMSESGIFWSKRDQTMVGQVYHRNNNKKTLTKYSPKFNDLIEVVTLDGLFISVDKNKIKKLFDEDINGFHFYDHSFCVSNFIEGVKLGVTFSFDITHNSEGKPNEEFFKIKEIFLEKYKKYLPLDLKPKNIFYEKIKRKNFKKLKKVAIIIPTKGNLELLINCVNSFYSNCDHDIFSIFIADTGSTKEELDQIKISFEDYKNLKIIEYDYYNFAKINNDVVKNYVGNGHDFLLFCNNDIEIKNDVLSSMLNVFLTNKDCGSVGCRLHYPNNTIQHNGVIVHSDKVLNANNFEELYPSINLTHEKLNNYYNFNNTVREVFCNTAALLLINKDLFIKMGLFNENYNNCFEDVELGIKVLSNGFKNYNDGYSVAYHKESYTRKNDEKYLDESKKDFKETLHPFILENKNLVSKWIKVINTFIYKNDKFIKI
jgi:GT2 family glycosyltransferase